VEAKLKKVSVQSDAPAALFFWNMSHYPLYRRLGDATASMDALASRAVKPTPAVQLVLSRFTDSYSSSRDTVVVVVVVNSDGGNDSSSGSSNNTYP
jgi:hypothetical protein